MITISLHLDRRKLQRSIRALGAELEAILVDELGTAADAVVDDMRRRWPRRTGRSAEGFEVVRLPRGARIVNAVPYVPYVHRAGTKTLALDELTAPAIEAAIGAVPERAAQAAQRRIAP